MQSHRARRHPCYATATAEINALDLTKHEILAKLFDLICSVPPANYIETACSTLACVDHRQHLHPCHIDIAVCVADTRPE